jgi:DNA-binding NtrC family response regulator
MVRVTSLCERPEDIPVSARALLARDAQMRGRRFGVPALSFLAEHPWPGNVRELHNVLRVAVATAESNVVSRPALEAAIGASSRPSMPGGAERAPRLEETTLAALRARHKAEVRELVGRALARADGNKLQAARAPGVSRQGLYRVLDES